jgi:hypothetical protein
MIIEVFVSKGGAQYVEGTYIVLSKRWHTNCETFHIKCLIASSSPSSPLASRLTTPLEDEVPPRLNSIHRKERERFANRAQVSVDKNVDTSGVASHHFPRRRASSQAYDRIVVDYSTISSS